MGHEETIRIYRSDVPGAEPPSLTYGELAANLTDKKVFVGGVGGTADMIVLREFDAVETINSVSPIVGAINLELLGDDGALIPRIVSPTIPGNTVSLGIGARIATHSLTGVASFNPTFFTVNSGAVGLSGVYGTVGVTGLSAGHTGIALDGTTGNVRIFNMGILSINGQTGHYTLPPVGATGDTVLPGSGIAIPETSGNTRTIINVGVTGISAGHTGISFSGTTGNIQVFNMGVLSVNGNTGHINLDDILIEGATGDTVREGIAIGIVRAGNDVTINNLGVTSFNGLTGTISYAPAIASIGASGVASFLSRDFTVSGTGHVSLFANSIDIDSGDGINVVGGGKVELGQSVTIRNTGVTSFNGSTGSISLINFVQGDGIVTQTVGNKVVFTNIGVTSLNGLTGARTLTGDGGAIIGVANTQIGARLATTGATGVASFDGDIFTVSAGKVGLTDGGIRNGYLANSSIKITTGSGLVGGATVSLGGEITLTNVGVTGLSAGHTGVSLVGTTGNVRIFNMGILSINGQTGHYTIPPVGATGDTVLAGSGILVSNPSSNVATITNIGVTSIIRDATTITGDIRFNAGAGITFAYGTGGLTFVNTGVLSINNQFPVNGNFTIEAATVVTGDGGALVGDGVQIKARIADHSATGVASFNPTFFSVANGAVGLSGIYGTVGVTGLSAGHTGISLIGTTGNVRIFNMGVLSVDGSTGHIDATRIRQIVGPTGDTVQAGQFITIGANKTINNVGVQKFNGLTGEVTYTPPLATITATGVASFNSTFFSVANGAVSLTGAYGTIGVTGLSAGHTGIALIGTTGNVRIFNMGVHTFNGQTGHVTYAPPIATINGMGNTGTRGLATFNENFFTVSSGAVGLKSTTVTARASFNETVPFYTVGDGVGTLTITGSSGIQTTVSGAGSPLFTILNTGVTGLSAGHTGISLIGTTGNVRIFNMGVLSVNGNTGHISAETIRNIVGPTGDTVQAGQFITIDANKTISNVGVQTFNGLTGAVGVTGDGGAIIGASNNTIRARLADHSATGVASFNPTFFSVANGAVSLSGAYGTIGVTGLSAGHTGISLVGTTGNVRIFNMGILSINGQTGHYTIPTLGATGDTVVAGVGISVVPEAGNVRRIHNIGVTSFNGLTGAITYTLPLATTGASGVASFSSSNFVLSPTGHVSLQPIRLRELADFDEETLDDEGLVLTYDPNRQDQTQPFFMSTVSNLYTPPTATYTVKGIANFNPAFFNVATGTVSLSGAYGTIGVTGLSAGHTGIALVGTTGNVRIFNMGVLSVNGNTGHISADTIRSIVGPTGDTVQAGQFITIDANKTISNVGVQTFNGLTGARTLTGDGGALAGVDNSIIRARLATTGSTGVASFSASDFVVSGTGHVSLTGNVARTNVSNNFTASNTFNAFQFFPQGFNTGRGVTFASQAEPVNMRQNLNVDGNISAANFLSWEVITTDKTLSPYKGVFANKSPGSGQLILTIALSSSTTGVGTLIEVSGITGSWKVKIPNNHTVHFGNVTIAGTALEDGFLESTHHRDCIRMVCCAKSGTTSQWNVLSSVGIINYGMESSGGLEGGELG